VVRHKGHLGATTDHETERCREPGHTTGSVGRTINGVHNHHGRIGITGDTALLGEHRDPGCAEHLKTGVVGGDIEGVLTMTMTRRTPVGGDSQHLGHSIGGRIEEIEHLVATLRDMELTVVDRLTGRAHNQQR